MNVGDRIYYTGLNLDRFEIVEKSDFESLKLRYLELSSLFEINKILNSTLDLNTILDNVLLTPMGRLLLTRGAVLLKQKPGVLKFVRSKGLSDSVLGKCLSIKRIPDKISILVPKKQNTETFWKQMEEYGLQLILPLQTRNETLGLLAYGGKLNQQEFSATELEFLDSVASIASIAVEKSLLFNEIQSTNKKLDKKIQELNTLFEISRELNSTLDAGKIANVLAFAIMGEFLIKKCVIFLTENGKLKVEAAKGFRNDQEKSLRSECVLPEEWANLNENDPYIILDNLPESVLKQPICQILRTNQIHYLVPLYSKENFCGLIGIGKKITGESVSSAEIKFLQTLGNNAMISIENARMVQEMIEKERLENELKIAREIQQKLIPERFPELPGFQMAGKNIPSYQVGGDYYDCIPLADDRFGIAIADVAGKSTPAALLMANLQATLQAITRDYKEVDETVYRVNELICQNTTIDKYITFFYGILDTKDRRFAYVNAGHNPPLYVKKSGEIQLLSEGGLILGFTKELTYRKGEIQLEPGDLIFLYTDGVTEAMNRAGEEFEEKRLFPLILENRALSAEQLIERVKKEIQQFSEGIFQSDDITMIALKAVR